LGEDIKNNIPRDKKLKRERLFGFDFVSSKNFDKIIIEIENYDHKSIFLPIISTPNIDQIVKLDRDPKLKEMICNSFLILPDGQPIIWLSRLFNKKLLSRLTGSDLFPIFWDRVLKKGDKIVLIVPTTTVKNRLELENTQAIFYVTPYFEIDDNIYKSIVKDIDRVIKENSPRYVIIALPFYKRERLCQSLLDKDNKDTIYILLGASLEFYTNIKQRAPIWIQKIGLEWFHRFLHEPKRLFRRYFIDSWYIIIVIYKEVRKMYAIR